MSVIRKRVQDHKYLVCAIYDGLHTKSTLTRIDPVGIVVARSPSGAAVRAKRNHKPNIIPTRYVASIILGTFSINAHSSQRFTCEELIQRSR